jgi:hypothetical protein
MRGLIDQREWLTVFFLPETNTRLPPRPARGRRTWISVATSHSSMPSA